MTLLDWLVVGIYIGVLVGLSVWIGRRQKTQTDYYVAGRRLGAWPIALSIIATQCSANSLIGAPAFIALKDNGGLKWLQYELAVPLAAIALLFLVPVYFQRQITTIYEVVEDRFGPAMRTTLSAVFIVSRALGTAVTLYATAVVAAVCLDWPVWTALLFVGFISMLYTTIGGIEADIVSDIMQLVVLYLGTLACIGIVLYLLGGFPEAFEEVEATRRQVVDMRHSGLRSREYEYSFWPMLIGGFFLYVSYYGCDQSQAQRLLTARSQRQAQLAVVINGVLRFVLVSTYCLFGLLLALFMARRPDFAQMIPPNEPNQLVPAFILEHVPMGLRGLIIAGIIAASMSSLDSAINSLSAAVQRDFLDRYDVTGRLPLLHKEVLRARLITISWGVICTAFAYIYTSKAHTVLELVNIVGSAVNGPVLAVFLFTLLRRRITGPKMIGGLLAGLACNMLLWQLPVLVKGAPEVAWMWWNATGFIVTFGTAWGLSTKDNRERFRKKVPRSYLIVLGIAFVLMMLCLVVLDKYL